MKHAILGAGQVAQAIADNLHGEAVMFDRGEWEGIEKPVFDVLHICIPYSEHFIKVSKQAIHEFHPTESTVIHSTVRPGTTRLLGEGVLYSPVNGRHGDGFADNIRNYAKYFSGDEELLNRIAAQFMFPCEHFGTNHDELEYAKIMCTTQMYWNIMFQHVLYDDCQKNGYNFDKVYAEWGVNYNQGISDEHPDWVRPIYDYVEGKAGGHCLSNNLQLTNNLVTHILKQWENNAAG